MTNERTQSIEDEDEALLARCIERFAEVGAAAVDELAGGDRERAVRLHARLAALERLGLLAGHGAAPLVIGPYRLLDFLGQGGMGAVYLAQDERNGHNVALKLCHAPFGPPMSGGGGGAGEADGALSRSRARFEREIRAAAQLEHPGIVAIHDVGESAGRAYFTMEYVEGATLARIVEELRASGTAFEAITPATIHTIVAPQVHDTELAGFGRTYVECACRWVIEIAEALAHAHAHGIVHRDVKPSNLMVQPDGHAKLFDLGLARVGDQPGLTRSGDLAGSPYYMSPEQVAGAHERVDHRTDVYSLGVTLFELLTLRRPFEGPTSAQVFKQIAGKEPPLLRRLNPQVPRELETVCLTALEKDPERRYRSADELAADLRRFLSFQPVRAKPASAARKTARFVRRNPALASALGLAALVLFGLPIGLLWANAAIRAEQRRVEREALLKSKVTDFLVDQFALTEAERAKGATISARELLDRGAERVENEFADDLPVSAALLAAIGRVYKNLGLYERAIPLLDRALAIRQRTEEDSLALPELLDDLAAAHLATGQSDLALRMCERGLGLLEGTDAAASLTAVRLNRTLADAARSMGDLDGAQRALERALELWRDAGAADDREMASVLERLGAVCLARGELPRAKEALERAQELHRSVWSPDLDALTRVLGDLATVSERSGNAQRASELRAEAASFTRALAAGPPLGPPPFELEAGAAAGDESFQRGITALQARELERSIQAFTRCLELDPKRAVCAYNIACCHALAGDIERGLEWLQRALDLGFGVVDYRLRIAESDPEVAPLRADPRGAALLARMRSHAERVHAFAAEPALWLPVARKDRGPLLVVLHAEGQTKLDVVRGPWRALAEALGAALLAPSGAITSGAEPELGLDWFEDARDLVRQPSCERRVLAAVRAFTADHAYDPERVWIAGESHGAMVAFDVALRSPGLFRGVILWNGAIHPDTPPDRARAAAALGLRVALAVGARPSLPTAEVSNRVESWFLEHGFHDPDFLWATATRDGNGISQLRGVLARW